jgi:hypothetical protein
MRVGDEPTSTAAELTERSGARVGLDTDHVEASVGVSENGAEVARFEIVEGALIGTPSRDLVNQAGLSRLLAVLADADRWRAVRFPTIGAADDPAEGGVLVGIGGAVCVRGASGSPECVDDAIRQELMGTR